jgi:hypothetical protein
MQQNLWFHLLSFLGSALEVPKYIYYLVVTAPDDGQSYSLNIYPLHLTSLLCIYISFCIIINLWGSAIVFSTKDGAKAKMLRLVLLVLCLVDFSLMAGTILRGFQLGNMGDLVEHGAQPYTALVVYQTSGMVILSVFFLIFGFAALRKISRTFMRSDGWKSDAEFYMGLIRLNVIIVVCFVCFTMKAVCTLLLIFGSSDSTCDNPLTKKYGVTTMPWYFIYEWIPDIVPRLALLYLMSRNLSDSDDARNGMSTSGDGVRRSDAFSDERFLSFDRDTEKGQSSEDMSRADELRKKLLSANEGASSGSSGGEEKKG